MTVSGTGITRGRLAWPDVAKGVSILGVVLLHVSLAVPQGMETTAANINQILDPLRMPLFFLVSGFFSAKVLSFSLSELFLRRLWFFIVPYVVWVPVELWLKFREYNMFDGTPMPGPGVYLSHLFEARNMYWFLFALTVFNLFLWCTRNLPAWAGLLAGFAPVLFLPLHSDFHMVGKAVLYLPVFLAGVYLRKHIRAYADQAFHPRRFIPAAVAYVAGFSVLSAWSLYASRSDILLPWLLPGAETIGYSDVRLLVNSLVQLLMIPVAIAGAVALSRIPLVSEFLKFLGRHTLVIYLGHAIALTVLYHYNMRAMDIEISRDADSPLHSTAFWMVVGLAISAVGSFFFWVLTRIPGIRLTIMPPQLPFGVRQRPAGTPALRVDAADHAAPGVAPVPVAVDGESKNR